MLNNEIMSIFRKWYAEIYEINETGTEDINLLITLLENQPKKVLEVACGGGRILIPIARAGHEVKGFDMDEGRLSYIPMKAKELENLKYCSMDAINGDWGNGYDVVILAGNLLQNIVADMPYDVAQQLFIQKAAYSLKVGGYIFLDFSLFSRPEKIYSKSNERIIFEGTDSSGIYGKHVIIGDGYNSKTHMAYGKRYTELTLCDSQQETIREKWEKHIPTLEQVRKWLTDYGFVIDKEFGDYSGSPISEKTCKAIIWAKKIN